MGCRAKPCPADGVRYAMKIVASVGVKDEVELIEQLIDHLRRIGVDQIIVCDMHSTDGTAEILERHRSTDFWVYTMGEEGLAEWGYRNLEWVNQAGADWVIFVDADEFPIPASGSLRDCAALDRVDALIIERLNVPLRPDGPAIPDPLVPERYEELLLIVDPERRPWSKMRDDPNASWMRARVAPRVMARPERIEALTLGTHDVVGKGTPPVRRIVPTDLVCAHLPFTTLERFSRKVANIRATFEAHDEAYGETYGHHWRHWLDLDARGLLEHEFRRMVFDGKTLGELRRRRVVGSAAELFADPGLIGHAALPANRSTR